jgi:paraquat-inducible protein B
LITRGLRAQLNTQSLLTGLLYIELDFHPATPLNLADIDSRYIQLPTIPTNLQRIAQKLEDIDVSKLTVTRRVSAIASTIWSAVKNSRTCPPTSQYDGYHARSRHRLQDQLASTGPKLTTCWIDHRHRGECECRAAKFATLIEGNLKVLNEAIALSRA